MRSIRKAAVILSIAGSALLTQGVIGCSKEPQQSSAQEVAPAEKQQAQVEAPKAADVITADVKKEASDIFASRCTPCHGPNGKGDGPASAGLTPPPRNFTDKAWQASVTDEHIEQIIQYGGAAVGKSPAMPPNPDLVDKPVIKGLRDHIRTLGK